MKQEILTQFPYPWLPSLGLLIFFFFFVGLLISVGMKSRHQTFARAESLPLHDGEKL